MEIKLTLDELQPGQVGTIIRITGDERLQSVLREIGFAEQDEVEVLHHGPLGKSPISVRLNRMMVALRRDEAASIDVQIVS